MIVRDLRSKVWFAIGPAQQSVERIEEDAGSTNVMIMIIMVVNDDDENEDDGDEKE